jgi:nucleoid-associated protein Lsr2
MAKEVIERLVDDIDGSEATESIVFGVDGLAFRIDLNDHHANELRTKLGQFVEVARRVRDQTGRAGQTARRTVTDKDRNFAIRQWALSEGVELPSRGRIAGAVQQAFDAADVAALYEAAGLEQEVAPAPKRSRRRAAGIEFSAKH